jgi:hypothetical protein
MNLGGSISDLTLIKLGGAAGADGREDRTATKAEEVVSDGGATNH